MHCIHNITTFRKLVTLTYTFNTNNLLLTSRLGNDFRTMLEKDKDTLKCFSLRRVKFMSMTPELIPVLP